MTERPEYREKFRKFTLRGNNERIPKERKGEDINPDPTLELKLRLQQPTEFKKELTSIMTQENKGRIEARVILNRRLRDIQTYLEKEGSEQRLMDEVVSQENSEGEIEEVRILYIEEIPEE